MRNIIEKIKFYGHYGKRVKGLIFCNNNEESRALSHQFNLKGYATTTLLGSDFQEKRDGAIKRLEQEDAEEALDYIFTVDIFNDYCDIIGLS